MSTSTLRLPRPRTAAAAGEALALLGPVLASDLPPAGPLRPGMWARVRSDLGIRREGRAFERALRAMGTSEATDLLAARRHV